MNGPHGFLDGAGQRIGSFAIQQVELESARTLTRRRLERARRLLAGSIGEGNHPAVRDQGLNDGAANPAIPSRHQRNAVTHSVLLAVSSRPATKLTLPTRGS